MLVIILSVLLYFIIAALVANAMQEIVKTKGHDKSYWLWCFFLMPIGILMVIALPDNRVVALLQRQNEMLANKK